MTATESLAAVMWRRSARQFFALFVLAVAVTQAHLFYSRSLANGGEAWMAGDWFINYAGGFVRRGLFGELFLKTGASGATGLWTLFWLQAALYAAVLAYLVAVLYRCRFSWSSIALVCSPAGIAFIGWDINGGFRKELLVFLTLLILALTRWTAGRLPAVAGTVLALAVYTIAVFSWEPATLLLPAVAYLLLSRPASGLVVFRRSAFALFAAVSLLGGVLSMAYPGDPATADLICQAVREHGFLGPSLCGDADTGGGGIDAIGWTQARALGDVSASFPLYVGYLPLIALAFLPVVLSRWFKRNWGWAVAITVAFLPMYLIVTDYGRWTHILIVALTFCITAHEPDEVTSPLWNPMLTIIYVVLWGLPHHLTPDSTEFPWMGLVSTLVVSGIQWSAHLLGLPADPGNVGVR
ncbi:MAG: hypothetical protein ACLGHZ_05395 [Actinomycetes bacterium]